ncbi:HNH endonuclease domain-containing protein [Sedimenticola hydrogenitrophicus]|uniref:HNH endonuclease domain-containing protein n=1 Tax=Sedimenticola hydrogenitrophicus TaxID=2967975 RepID=UPI0021A68D73|nr:HNH endonuclease domain-containing protein [Sedimenticola hydrogenitrophicus]
MSEQERNKERSEHRQFLMTMSGGVYEGEDLEEIFRIQEGKCYFTGTPLSPPSHDKKNYSLDHLRPVCRRGSCWPENLAYVLKEVNQEKHDRSKAVYWNILEKRHGTDWVNERKSIAKEIDKKRKLIDKRRKLTVDMLLNLFQGHLADKYPGNEIDFSLTKDDFLQLTVNDVGVYFDPGFIRKKRKFKDASYFEGIVQGIIGRG